MNDDSTQRATQAAIPQQETRDISEAETRDHTHEFPALGERDGRFYMAKSFEGTGELPDSVHDAAAEELRVHAVNQGWLPVGTEYLVDQSAQHETRWDVTYSVAVTPNEIGG